MPVLVLAGLDLIAAEPCACGEIFPAAVFYFHEVVRVDRMTVAVAAT